MKEAPSPRGGLAMCPFWRNSISLILSLSNVMFFCMHFIQKIKRPDREGASQSLQQNRERCCTLNLELEMVAFGEERE